MPRFEYNTNPQSKLTLIRDASGPNAVPTQHTMSCHDRLDHLAALLPEFAAWAASAKCETLAGLLELASQEALLRRHDR